MSWRDISSSNMLYFYTLKNAGLSAGKNMDEPSDWVFYAHRWVIAQKVKNL